MSVLKKLAGIFEKPKAKERVWLPRAGRVHINPLHNISFKRNDPPMVGAIGLANLSISGMAFIRNSGQEWPLVGSGFKGNLSLNGKEIPLEAKVVRVDEHTVACQFTGEITPLKEVIEGYFKVELAGLKMTKVSQERLREESDGTPYWFFGNNNCELYFVENAAKILRFHLSFFGNYIEGGQGLKLKFGYVTEAEAEGNVPGMKSSSLVRTIAGLPADVHDAALKLLAQVPGITPGQISELTRHLEQKPS